MERMSPSSSARAHPAHRRPIRPAVLLVCALAGAVLSGAAPVTNVPSARMPAPDGELVLQGRYVFERTCQVCHGRWGDGRGEMAAAMFPKPRRLTSGIFKYHTTPPGRLPTDADLERTIRSGLPGTSMPAFGAMPGRDLEAVIAYLKTLSPRWHWATNHAPPVVLPPAPEWVTDDPGRAAHAASGGRLFLTLCGPCHGPTADGKGPSAPGLEDQWGQPAPPPDLRQPLARSGPDPSDLYRVILHGIDGTPMPGYAEATTEAQRWELVGFILRCREDYRSAAK